MNVKRIVSLLLALAMVFGMVPPSQAHAKGEDEFVEADYKVENADGKSYKVYEFTDLFGTPDTNDEMNIGGLEISKSKVMEAVRGSNPSLGEEIPDADSCMVDVVWTTYDLTPGQLGTPVHFQIYDKTSDKIIAQTEDITAKEDSKKYKFYKLPAWDESGVSHDKNNWQLRAPNEYRFDIRLKTGTSGHAKHSNLKAIISQRGMPIYRAEYYTNKTVPTIKAQRTNKYDNTDEVTINPENLTGDQYYSWAQSIDGGRKPYFEGRLLDIQTYGNDTLESLQVSDDITAGRVKMAMKAPGKTEFDRGPGTFTDNGTPYHYEVTGDYLHLHIFTIRQDLKVKFDPNKGTWKNSAPADQTIGHSMKLADSWAGLGPITVPGAANLTPPTVAAGKPEKEFIGWNTDANATTALFTDNTYAEPITKDETFYAIYKEKAQGKVTLKYVDANDAEITDVKYHIDGQEYPAEKPGNKDEEVASALLQTSAAPKFLGYEVTEVKVDGKTQANEKVTYTEDGKYTIKYKYKKLDPIIPEKDATQDVKDTYKKVTIKVDSAKGKFQKNSNDVTGTEFLYYVNPVEGKKLQDVLTESGLTPKSKDENANKIDTAKPWIFTPDKTKTDTPADVALTTEVNKDNFKGVDNVVMEVNFGQTKADQLKDKLDPVTIKVWVDETDTDGSKINWKEGVKLKEANKDDETLKGLLAAATVTDLGENGTIAQPGTARNSSNQNLPDGKKGNLKVAFDDGSSLVVNDQMLYVAPHKNDNNKNLPEDAVKVDFKIGDGVTGTEKTKYVKPGTDVKEDAPKVSAKEGFKDAKWYKGDAVATDDDYKVTAKETVFTAKATGKDKVVKLDDPDNPTNFPKDPTDNSKKDADYVTVKFVADANGKIKENGTVKEKGIAYAVLKNTKWADAVTAGVVVPTEFEGTTEFYSFKEWQDDGNKKVENDKFPDVKDKDLTYTAVFGKADELSVTYNLNAPEGLTVGGKAPKDDTKYLKDKEVTVKALEADNKLAGYEFKGWNTKADGKGTTYAAGAKFAIKANTELFAQWNKTAPDVIPVDNENDEKGKNGEEIPSNYVFVEFKVKDADNTKAKIKDGQQAKFKVDPKATVTLTAPELEVKDASYTASFNKSDYTNKKFEQATTIWAVVIEKLVRPVDPTNPDKKDDEVVVKFLKGEHGKLSGIALVGGKEENVTGRDALAYCVKKKDAKGAATTWADMKYYIPTAVADYGWRVANPSWNPILPEDSKLVEKEAKEFTAQYVAKPIDEYITLTLDENYRNGKITDYEVLEGDLIEDYLYIPRRRGYIFKGWSYDSRRLEEVRPGDRIYYSTTLYAIWTKQKAKDDEEVEPIDTRPVNEHKAYMFGYTDGSVRPNGSITRAEAAALVTRLLGIEANASSMKPAFTDTPSSWYNKAINAAVARGIMKGYPDGRFRPNAPITRAEFTQMIYTFDNKPYGVATFADVVGHWAERAIGSEYQAGRITGYPDGLFRPDANITRAEAVVILNKIFERNYDAMSPINAMNKEKIKVFTDLHTSFWGYNDMVEATNTHDFKRRRPGFVEEDWTLVK